MATLEEGMAAHKRLTEAGHKPTTENMRSEIGGTKNQALSIKNAVETELARQEAEGDDLTANDKLLPGESGEFMRRR